MGIAAGGKLIQDVHKDARGWDGEVSWARYLTKLVNIQIVDSADFEASTHIVPPPTPVSAKNYADAGLPFYLTGESKQDRLKESKILSAIKSVSGLDRKLGVGTSVDNDIDPAKPGKCCTCSTRLSDCVTRPCNHKFCSVCITAVAQKNRCPSCKGTVKHVAGFSAPMNLPGEETYKVNVPVVMLEVKDGVTISSAMEEMRL